MRGNGLVSISVATKYCQVLFLLICVLLLPSLLHAENESIRMEPPGLEGLIKQFAVFDKAINKGEGYSDADSFAWGESYLLEAYLVMYEATGETGWLDKFVTQGMRVIALTDKARGLTDYKGRSLVGWSSRKYSLPSGWQPGDKVDSAIENKPRVVYPVHTGMIVYPFVVFARIVRERGDLLQYRQNADYFTKVAEEAVDVFNKDWRFDKASGEGYLATEKGEPTLWAMSNDKVPFDYDSALGRAYVGLCGLTGKQGYCTKSRALALTLKNSLTLDGGQYVMYYSSMLGSPVVDISHAAINAEFAFLAYKAGLIFTKEDIMRCCRILIRAYNGRSFARFVDGTGEDDAAKTFSIAAARWLDLSSVNCDVYAVVFEFTSGYLRDQTRVTPQVLLGLAKMIKYGAICQRNPSKPVSREKTEQTSDILRIAKVHVTNSTRFSPSPNSPQDIFSKNYTKYASAQVNGFNFFEFAVANLKESYRGNTVEIKWYGEDNYPTRFTLFIKDGARWRKIIGEDQWKPHGPVYRARVNQIIRNNDEFRLETHDYYGKPLLLIRKISFYGEKTGG